MFLSAPRSSFRRVVARNPPNTGGGSSLRLLHKLPHEGVLGISFPDYKTSPCLQHTSRRNTTGRTLQYTSLHETVWSQMWYFTPIFWRTRLTKPFKSITKLFHPLLHTPCKISNLLVDISRYIFSLQKVGRFLVGDHVLIPDSLLVELLWCQFWASGKTEEGKDPYGSRLHVFVGNRHGDLFSLALDEVCAAQLGDPISVPIIIMTLRAHQIWPQLCSLINRTILLVASRSIWSSCSWSEAQIICVTKRNLRPSV